MWYWWILVFDHMHTTVRVEHKIYAAMRFYDVFCGDWMKKIWDTQNIQSKDIKLQTRKSKIRQKCLVDKHLVYSTSIFHVCLVCVNFIQCSCCVICLHFTFIFFYLHTSSLLCLYKIDLLIKVLLECLLCWVFKMIIL